jgi:hypothetical protein
MNRSLVFALLLWAACVLRAGARDWIKGSLHPAYTSMYLFLEDIDPQIYYQVPAALLAPLCHSPSNPQSRVSCPIQPLAADWHLE